jgi:nitrate/nitrite transport system ATP-binding protein
MTNGPGAAIAEIVENPLPKARVRTDIHRHPLYYATRNHIIDFLVTRSKAFDKTGHDPRNVPVVRPGLPEPSIAASSHPSSCRAAATATRPGNPPPRPP